MTTTMEYVLREVRRTDTYNLALDAYYFSKGLACDTMDGFEEGAPGVLELLERAGKTGMEWMAQALEVVATASQIVLKMLQRAANTGKDLMEIAVDMLAGYWGFYNGQGPSSESGVCETELVQMVAKDSAYPTE